MALCGVAVVAWLWGSGAVRRGEALARLDAASVVDSRTAALRADNARREQLAARAADLNGAELLELDVLMHRGGGAHVDVHQRATMTRLDSTARLLALRPARFLEAEAVLQELAPPLGTTEEAERRRLLDAITEHRANGRAMAIRGRSDCNPTLTKIRASMQRHPDWPDHVLSAIICGSITLGMTGEQVIAGWGRPTDINRTTRRSGVHEQWVYRQYERAYVYFEDGVVTAIQN